ncbi:MAG TPA: sigma 54-interacting transcriptional regulator, partial [Longimicrobiaceae bacterium]
EEIEWTARQPGFQAWAGYPLLFRGELLGVLDVVFPRPIGADEFEQLEVFAYQAATVIQSARLYTELQRLKDRLEVENAYLQEEIRSGWGFEEIVGDSPALRSVLGRVRQVAPTDSTVLLLGETGTGKELVARAIHALSPRRGRPFVKVNCGGLPSGLVESELFGHERGAFTGAVQRRIGRFELADRGTLFLDEVGELPLEAQVKLLRVLQEQEFERVGSSRPTRVDVRLVAATNRDLAAAVAAGTFRADLFFRLNVFPIRMPALRERPTDIPLLAQHFLAASARRLGKQLAGVSREGMRRLLGYSGPGNIRELQNVVERACILATGPVVEIGEELAAVPPRRSPPPAGLTTLAEMERAHIARVLEETGGRIQGEGGAAAILGLHPNTLRSRMDRLGIGRSALR